MMYPGTPSEVIWEIGAFASLNKKGKCLLAISNIEYLHSHFSYQKLWAVLLYLLFLKKGSIFRP